jgi:hypothetical protein
VKGVINMLRRIALSLGLLVSMIVILPLATSTAHNLRSQFMGSHHYRRHSRAWWRRHRALLHRRQALMARRRALMAARNNGVPLSVSKSSENHVTLPATLGLPDGIYRNGALAMPLPNGWSAAAAKNGVSSFRIVPPTGMPEGQATLSVVTAAATPNQVFARQQRNALAGVSFSDLRRNVIDKMITAGGWVVNDRQREIGGQRVFEVVAQTPAANGKSEQVWNFYFTEVNGRIYSLTTQTAESFSGRVTSDAEKFLASFPPAQGNKNK